MTRRSGIVVFTLFCLGLSGLISCSGGNSTPPEPPPTPVSITFATAEAGDLLEESSETLTLTVNLSQPVQRRVTAGISVSGQATRDLDYSIQPASVFFEPNQTSAVIEVSSIDDWLVEGVEVAELSFTQLSTAVSTGTIATASFSIKEQDQVFDRSGSADFYVYSTQDFRWTEVSFNVTVLNVGSLETPSTRLRTYVFDNKDGFQGVYSADEYDTFRVPSLAAGTSASFVSKIDLQDLDPGRSYITFADLELSDREGPTATLPNYDYRGFTLDSSGELLLTCSPPNRPSSGTADDPLIDEQWGLVNTGQRAFAEFPGNAGEDIGMQQVIADETPTGDQIRVAIVDTGMEICHPDLAGNVEPNGSFHFKSHIFSRTNWWDIEETDPFLPDTTGDHGTSVAGIVGAVFNNGLGMRGTAPRVRLYGFNFLTEQCCYDDSLGGSSAYPNSRQIDIFNMSFGSLPSQRVYPNNSIFSYGTSNLRGGRGAVYVKAAGNAFSRPCLLSHPVNNALGCSAASGSSSNNLPFLILVGAVNASGQKASYSSVGSNLWISAPAGEYGGSYPATITTDQIGLDRGYKTISRRGLATNEARSPHGDYISTFNGTSSATPHVSGAVALMLEANPELTWRDVKHILAQTARIPQSAIYTDHQVAIGSSVVDIQDHWITNAAGYSFHNWFGFGVVDVDQALEFINSGFQANNLGEFSDISVVSQEDVAVSIPDAEGGGVTQSVSVDLGGSGHVEAVQLLIKATHPSPWDLGIELSSPSGTRSIINQVFNGALATSTELDWQLLSNAFYGESPNGQWQLKVYDALEEETGTLDSWELIIWYGDHPAG